MIRKIRKIWLLLIAAWPVRNTKHVCAYCHGAGTVPDSGMFCENCPICAGSGM